MNVAYGLAARLAGLPLQLSRSGEDSHLIEKVTL